MIDLAQRVIHANTWRTTPIKFSGDAHTAAMRAIDVAKLQSRRLSTNTYTALPVSFNMVAVPCSDGTTLYTPVFDVTAYNKHAPCGIHKAHFERNGYYTI